MGSSTELTLEYLRQQIRDECISYSELQLLQELSDCIDPGDLELLEAAGVPEFSDECGESHCAICLEAYGCAGCE